MRVKQGQKLWYTRVTTQWSGGGEEGCSDCVEWPQGGLEVLGSFYASRAPSVSRNVKIFSERDPENTPEYFAISLSVRDPLRAPLPRQMALAVYYFLLFSLPSLLSSWQTAFVLISELS